jgi:hypothetical protein
VKERRTPIEKEANRNVWDSGWESAHAAVARRPQISFSRIVARTYSHEHVHREGLGVADRSRTLFCRPVPNPTWLLVRRTRERG